MATTSQQRNLLAAKWSPNGHAMGASDLTTFGSELYGSNVFSPAVQRADPRPAQELGQVALEGSENPLVAKDSGARPPSGVVRHQSHRWAKLKLTGRRIAHRANRSIENFDTCTR